MRNNWKPLTWRKLIFTCGFYILHIQMFNVFSTYLLYILKIKVKWPGAGEIVQQIRYFHCTWPTWVPSPASSMLSWAPPGGVLKAEPGMIFEHGLVWPPTLLPQKWNDQSWTEPFLLIPYCSWNHFYFYSEWNLNTVVYRVVHNTDVSAMDYSYTGPTTSVCRAPSSTSVSSFPPLPPPPSLLPAQAQNNLFYVTCYNVYF